MKLRLMIVFALFANALYGQSDGDDALLDSAKVLFSKGGEISREDAGHYYSEIASLLTEVVKLDPDNAEARYFLAYTYSRINSHDAEGMINVSLDLTLKSSEQLEKVNQLTPLYTGEIIALDPYVKISAEWGSMAMHFLYNNKRDSAVWAFKEGQKRGGYSKYVLELNKKVLDACSKNAILMTCGDNSTMPLWFLQVVEGYRKDVAVVDADMLNSTWYPSYLSKNDIVKFDMPQQDIDTVNHIVWTDSLITIGDFAWTVKPTYYDYYLLRGDRLFLSILKQNKFKKDIYFTIGYVDRLKLGLNDYISPMVVVDKFVAKGKTEAVYASYKKSIENALSLSGYLNMNSTDEIRLFGFFRFILLQRISYYMDMGDMAKAKELLSIHDKYAQEEKLPYKSDYENRLINYFRHRL
jgi:hypothetical protein